MNHTWSNRGLAWLTRIIAALFVALNAFAWWDESQARQDPTLSGATSTDWVWQWAVLTHLLPLAVLAVATIIGWRMPAYGALGFLVYAAAQVVSVGTEWVYIPLVVMPPLIVAVLFFVGWMLSRRAVRRPNR